MKTPSVVVGVLSLAALFADPKPASAQATESACAFMTVGIVTNAARVFPGSSLGIGGSVRNCSTRKAKFTLVVSGLSSCGQRTEISSSRLALGPGENKSWTVSYTMPADTCSGIWEASAHLDDARDNVSADSSGSGRSPAGGHATVIID